MFLICYGDRHIKMLSLILPLENTTSLNTQENPAVSDEM